jgi:rhomboid protease GluP
VAFPPCDNPVIIARMQTGLTIIPARSEQQAMDWSLVLLSQGIENAIQPDAERARWNLVVDPPNYSRAIQVLRLYVTENRRRVWVQRVPWSQLVFDSRSAVWCVLLIVMYALQKEHKSIDVEGMMNGPGVRAGEWWRLLTATMLHADLPHLLSNVTIGLVLLGLAMAIYGPGIALLAAFVSGALGNVVGLILYPPPYYGRGASGMVMGALGLLAAHTVSLLREQHSDRLLLVRSVVAGCLLFVLFGFDPASDMIAHIGGFVAGAILGALITLGIKAPSERAWLNTLCGLGCGALASAAWYFALRK